VKLKLDENLPADLAALLRERGHDAMGAVEEGLGGSPDQRLLEVATNEGLILMTYDLDFVFRLQDQRWAALDVRG